MLRPKLLCCIVGLILCTTACSSNTSSSATISIDTTANVPTTLDGVDLARQEAWGKNLMDTVLRTVDITPPSSSLNGQAFLRAFSVYREYVANIRIPDVQFQGYDVTLDVLRNYLVELVATIDGILNAVISGNQSSMSVAEGKYTYLYNQFPILKSCLMDLRSDC
jgi:hypothetical protein